MGRDLMEGSGRAKGFKSAPETACPSTAFLEAPAALSSQWTVGAGAAYARLMPQRRFPSTMAI